MSNQEIGRGASATDRDKARLVLAEAAGSHLAALTLLFGAGLLPWLGVASPIFGLWIAGAVALEWGRRHVLSRAARRFEADGDPRPLLRTAVLGALACGIAQGTLPLLTLAVAAGPTGSLTLFAVAGLAAAALMQSHAPSQVTLAYACPALGGAALALIATGSPVEMALAGNVLLLLSVLVRSARRTEAMLVQNQRLQARASSLTASLAQAHSETMAATRTLSRLARHDPLTGLANRSAFLSELTRLVHGTEATRGRVALLVLDLDDFKSINDALGHGAGDLLLTEAARRIAADAEGRGLVARLGGDEFAVTLVGEDAPAEADALAARILASAQEPIQVDGRSVQIGVSLGLAVYPDDAGTPEDLFASADIALYAAKDGGRRRAARFDPVLRARVDRKQQIEIALRHALDRRELQVFFQPQISLATNAIIGFEALVRWAHPTLGWVPPGDIVAAARAVQLSQRLTTFVLEEATDLLAELARRGRGDLGVAVNVSPVEFSSYELAPVVRQVLTARGVSAHRLEIEITEEALLDTPVARREIDRLAALGVRVSVDDFGAGHSSLVYLAAVKVDRIKIDRRFVARLHGASRDADLIRAVLVVGRTLNLEVIAEGVETRDQAIILAALGCGAAQGYLFGSPMPAQELFGWMARHDGAAAQESGSSGAPAGSAA